MERIAAARQCQAKGFLVALKLEPVICTPDWVQEYKKLIATIANVLDIEALHHISIGCLRWSADLAKHRIFTNSYHDYIIGGTWIEHRPNKFNGTYSFNLRLQIYRQLKAILYGHNIRVPLNWSLEEPSMLQQLSLDSLDQ
jgi:hypothetical protein